MRLIMLESYHYSIIMTWTELEEENCMLSSFKLHKRSTYIRIMNWDYFKTVIECKNFDSTSVRNHCHTLSIKLEHWAKDLQIHQWIENYEF